MTGNLGRKSSPFLLWTALFAFLYCDLFFIVCGRVFLSESYAHSNHGVCKVLVFPILYLNPAPFASVVEFLLLVGINGVIWGACLAGLVRFFDITTDPSLIDRLLAAPRPNCQALSHRPGAESEEKLNNAVRRLWDPPRNMTPKQKAVRLAAAWVSLAIAIVVCSVSAQLDFGLSNRIIESAQHSGLRSWIMESSQLESPIDAQAFALLTTFAFWGGVVCAVLGLHGERANGWGVTVPPALAGLFLNICGAFGGLLLLPFASS